MTTDQAHTPFDEELLTGYLDGVLTQQEAQRVRLHLERDEEARRLYEELTEMRAAALQTPFRVDDQWDERPRGVASRVLRFTGLGLLVLWAAALLALVVWIPEEPQVAWLRVLHGAGVAGFLLTLSSAALDRVVSARSDIYRRVEK